MKKQYRELFIVLLAVTFWTFRGNVSAQSNASVLGPDILYVGDQADGTVKSFSTKDGSPAGFTTQTGQLKAPTGLLAAGGELVVVNQNAFKPFNGELLQYLLRDGKFAGPLVDQHDPDAPLQPRGVVLLKGNFYVANLAGNDTDPATQGAVYVFAGNGKLLGKLTPPPPPIRFFPRGIVFRDGFLYVSNCPNFTNAQGPGIGGQVLKFDPDTLEFKGVFIDDSAGGIGQLNRPEGLVFGPDGNLYVTSFRANVADTDSIRIYEGSSGAFKGKIDLYVIAKKEPRAFAQALLFGPGGKLYVPITGGGPTTGEIRRYDVLTQEEQKPPFVPSGILGSPWYLTFGRTNSATLSYEFQ